jgi:Fic family protein
MIVTVFGDDVSSEQRLKMNSTDEPRLETARTFDLREADAQYRPFPSFEEWSAESAVDSPRWERYAEIIRELKNTSPDLLPRALEVVKRAAAWDTGAIEGLYPTDRGFTLTVAIAVTAWENLVEQKGPNARALFESQLKAYDYVLDFATQRIPIAEAWIRQLHEVVCESQDEYAVKTSIGKQYQPLPKGEYKRSPNHVEQLDGSNHSWAPVDLTLAEMHRLCGELRSDAFGAAHPVMQSAYAHYAFVSVHPFADGNGRVARALASVFTNRAESIPLLILKSDAEYLPALEAADRGDFQRFVDFILDKAIDTIRLTEESFKAANAPTKEAALEKLTMLYLTGRAYTQSWVDEAGERLFALFKRETELQGPKDAVQGMVDFACHSETPGHLHYIGALLTGSNPVAKPEVAPKDAYRVSRPEKSWWFTFSSAPPARTTVSRWFQLEVPVDLAKEHNVLIRSLNTNETFEAEIAELTPEPSSALRIRLSIWINHLIAGTLNELAASAEASFKKQT